MGEQKPRFTFTARGVEQNAAVVRVINPTRCVACLQMAPRLHFGGFPHPPGKGVIIEAGEWAISVDGSSYFWHVECRPDLVHLEGT